MLPNSWETLLHLSLTQLKNDLKAPPKVAILGVGNELCADDAAGMLVARKLLDSPLVADVDHILIILAGQALENTTGQLRSFSPDLVLIIDAADMGDVPGSIHWLSAHDVTGTSAFTHSLPISMLMNYLMLELRCRVSLLGIQLASNEMDGAVCPEVSCAVNEIANEIFTVLFEVVEA